MVRGLTTCDDLEPLDHGDAAVRTSCRCSSCIRTRFAAWLSHSCARAQDQLAMRSSGISSATLAHVHLLRPPLQAVIPSPRPSDVAVDHPHHFIVPANRQARVQRLSSGLVGERRMSRPRLRRRSIWVPHCGHLTRRRPIRRSRMARGIWPRHSSSAFRARPSTRRPAA